MQATKVLLAISILILGLSATSCRRNSDDVWEDSKSATRHMSRGMRTLGGKHGDSRAVQNRDEFYVVDDNGFIYADDSSDDNGMGGGGYVNNNTPMNDFVPLSDQSYQNDVAMGDFVSRQPRETPGDPGSSIPGIEAFRDPSTNSQLAGVFRNINFEYNSNLVKGQENLDTVRRVSDYMKRNPGTYVFVEGHCDERGPEAYNLSLGSRRSNAVRNMLIQEGVNPDNVFTISYGKERPVHFDHNEEAWNQNRRAEFKVYQR